MLTRGSEATELTTDHLGLSHWVIIRAAVQMQSMLKRQTLDSVSTITIPIALTNLFGSTEWAIVYFAANTLRRSMQCVLLAKTIQTSLLVLPHTLPLGDSHITHTRTSISEGIHTRMTQTQTHHSQNAYLGLRPLWRQPGEAQKVETSFWMAHHPSHLYLSSVGWCFVGCGCLGWTSDEY
eukprot:Blabericola_migrator_1__659@NODE_1163_length_5233_cov_27_435927_g793_i0_p3_GENE_NODE_1163_length_5233_cov_27_435927_g793_i0NODE_1163_length_5233_cov_27_435927_g793_i0_p3_ORF_typecomplete_len180_score18_39Cytochrom_C_asm/PF01578_20/0_039_NODE_1163_length_5233_cov_27_435927_g793_i038084347